MQQTWSATRLSVPVTQNGAPAYSWQMATTDVEEFPFDAGETVDSAEWTLRDLSDDTETDSEEATITGEDNDIARVTIDAGEMELVRGHAYELQITFTAGAHVWSRTLIIEVVA